MSNVFNLRASFDSHWRTWRNEIIVMRHKQSLDKQESAIASSIMQSRCQETWKSATYRWKILWYSCISSMFTSISTWRSTRWYSAVLFRFVDTSWNTWNTRASRNIIFIDFRFVHAIPISPTFIQRRYPKTCKAQTIKHFAPVNKRIVHFYTMRARS